MAGNILLREGFKADGRVCLGFANVGMGLACTSVNPDTKMTLDLRAAKVGTFWDDAASWPDCGDLFLDGFVYERLDDHAPRDAASRIKWLRLQPADQFLPQPYEQLAAVFKKEGLEEDAKKILIAKNEDPARLRQMHNIFRKAWHYVKMVTIRYGYRPWYALIHAAIVVLLGWGLFWCGNQFGLISPSTTFAYVQYADPPNSLPAGYPTFHSFVYSLDVFLPIIDLHQESHWLPHRDTFDRGPYLPVLVRWSWRVLECSLQWYMWAQIMIGWLLTSLFIAGFTRIIRS